MARATLTISSKNYSSWSLRGWLMARLSGLAFDEIVVPPGDVAARAEILLLSSSILVPRLEHNGIHVWDTLAIGEYLNEVRPKAGLLPKDRAQGDIERITSVWRECLSRYGGPFLFGEICMADAMYAPVVTRFQTYDVKVDKTCAAYCARILALPDMKEWAGAAQAEPDAIDELEAGF
ncbi:MAG: glutathione S-transferase [Burkholderiales bacterium]